MILHGIARSRSRFLSQADLKPQDFEPQVARVQQDYSFALILVRNQRVQQIEQVAFQTLP